MKTPAEEMMRESLSCERTLRLADSSPSLLWAVLFWCNFSRVVSVFYDIQEVGLDDLVVLLALNSMTPCAGVEQATSPLFPGRRRQWLPIILD